MCAGPRLLKIKRQRSSTFTLLLISKSYWFDKPRFVNEGNCYLLHPRLRLGHHPTPQLRKQSELFLAPLSGTLELQQGESHTLNHFTLFLYCLLYFLFSLFFLLQNFKTQKKISLIFILVLFIFYLVAMIPPKFGMKDVKVGSGGCCWK